MPDASLIGLIAGACTTISFLPQAIHTFRTKDTSSISLGMYILFVFGVILWLFYGILVKDFPIIVANAITLLLATTILVMKVQHSYKIYISSKVR